MASVARISSSDSSDLQGIHADVWHAHALASAPQAVQPTGDARLDAQLPGGGWPVGALIELLQPAGVHSEWRLLLPALARSGQGPVVLVGAPQLPFVPALAAQGLAVARLVWVTAQAATARLWAAEQALRCAEVDAVLAWLPQARGDQLRRLQMAAADHHKLLFVMRAQQTQADASPALLRLQLVPQAPTQAQAAGSDTLAVHILKRRGPPLAEPLVLQARPARLAVWLAASQLPGQPPAATQEAHDHALDRIAVAA
ncbi:translesion DNA synthesis-associated protein ImuA [Rhodoferax saidenbachensis]|uniref:Protein ImuA n=1 Tax=Rhodoferax saidenbachensis TaxID=1484693 RepID=A0ABU1ZJV4_9BURK|nr:translesion DNA synthesis-associated protein ImuA [Rhodoferax saidenbachensis]MDR7305820.1 protein ImuA [Rhodoferax saidenbachensis]